MSDAPKKVYVLAEVVAELHEKHPPIVIDLGKGGDPLEVPPPQLWDDSVTELGDDNLAVAKKVMGEAGYKRFRAAGGTVAIFTEIIQDYAKVALGESSAS